MKILNKLFNHLGLNDQDDLHIVIITFINFCIIMLTLLFTVGIIMIIIHIITTGSETVSFGLIDVL